MRIGDAIFYHLYPLGALGVIDAHRDPTVTPSPLSRVADWIPRVQDVGANALWLGPVFESERHGYDTVDFFTVDRRLGTNEDLVKLAVRLRERGIALVLDAVFNHVGRTHPIVNEVVRLGATSPRSRWIAGFDPSRRGPGGLPFAYEGWAGHYDLVKLDTGNPDVREYLTNIALTWIEAYGIAGLRIDAANCIDRTFLRELGRRCRERVPDFFLLGESVHGDSYRPLLDEADLDSVTNFEAYKGLWSSYNDRNYHEIAWTLDRLFGAGGLCRGRLLYTFADNHDVDRVASVIRDSAGLYPLYGLMFAMPGIPSLYYGSEYGIGGRKAGGDDGPLRPSLDPAELPRAAPHPELARCIARFAAARRASPAVREGRYRALHITMEGLAFLRATHHDTAIIAVNGSAAPMAFPLRAPEPAGRTFVDLLDSSFRVAFDGEGAANIEVPPHWLRWLVASSSLQ